MVNKIFFRKDSIFIATGNYLLKHKLQGMQPIQSIDLIQDADIGVILKQPDWYVYKRKLVNGSILTSLMTMAPLPNNRGYVT